MSDPAALSGQRVSVVAPHFNLRGGIIKLLDYAQHLAALGADVAIYSDDFVEPALPLFSVPRLARIAQDIDFRPLRPTVASPGLEIRENDLVLFTWPPDFVLLASLAPRGFEHWRFVHLVQSTQHPNVLFAKGYGRRLLRQPVSRVHVSQPVAASCADFVPADAEQTIIEEGHDWEFFASGAPRPDASPATLNVGYITWKSHVGAVVEDRFKDNAAIEFRSIGHVSTWPELRDLYQWSDIFLGFPDPEEGFYMVGYEAMAAGALVALPDVGGNRAYCTFGINCVQTRYDDADSYVDAIELLGRFSAAERSEMRSAATASVRRFNLADERRQVGDFFVHLLQKSSS